MKKINQGEYLMIIVGELINSSRKAIKEAIDKGDIEYIKKIAVDQE